METEVGGDERAPDLHWQHFRPKEQQNHPKAVRLQSHKSWLNL